MKRFFRVVSCIMIAFLALPLLVKAEDDDPITLTCESESAFKVGTSRTCLVTIKDVNTLALFRVELGEGLTAKLFSTSDNYSIELVAEQTYLLTNVASDIEPAQLEITLSLASDATIDKTGIEVKLYKEYILLGDIDGNGIVSNSDALSIGQYINNSITLDEKQKKAADVNQDGSIDEADSKMAAKIAQNNLDPEYLPTNTGVSSGAVQFDADCTPASKEETVEVPDTASHLSAWIYVGGAVLMAFGIYLIVESKKASN